MIDAQLANGNTWLHRRDPRMRVVCAVAVSVAVIALQRHGFLVAAIGSGLAVAAMAGAVSTPLFKRLAALNFFMLVLLLLMPLMEPGSPLFHVGPLPFSAEGFAEAARVVLKGNAILIWITALLATLDPVTLGYALERLAVPSKLTRLLLFTVRYMSVLGVEYHQLRRAMRLRAFDPKANRHTFKMIGYLVGMLLVRALDRAERITDAMKCRGFTGHFRTVYPFRMQPADWAFALGAFMAMGALVWADSR